MTLTWVRRSDTIAASSNPSDVLTSISTAITGCVNWEVKSSALEYVVVGPLVGSEIPNFRVIFVGKNSGAPAVGSIGTPHTAASDIIYVGVAPDGMGTFAGVWDVADPTGGQRWSKYWKCSGILDTDRIVPIESEEILHIAFWDSTDKYRSATVGNWIEPANVDEGEDLSGRVYGMAVSGSDEIAATFWETNSGWLGGGSAGNTSPQNGIFQLDGAGTAFQLLQRLISSDPDDIMSGRLTTWKGRRAHIPIPFRLKAGEQQFVGVARQMKIGQDTLDGIILQDDLGTERSLIFGSKRTSPSDVLAFEQS